ncbi:MAG: class I SAM-dependent methyltransferase [Betaproteobacteria bacterium]
MPHEVIDRINLKTMRAADTVAQYSTSEKLRLHEQAALASVADEVRGQAILDIGVGAGRTVVPLLAISADYLAIDYSPEMVAACRARFPDVKVAFGDARDLSTIAGDSISLAVFSCNGISMVGHEDRLAIIREVQRVLKPGGVFVFTTYNLGSAEATRGFRLPDMEFSANPLRLAVRLARLSRDTAISFMQRRRNLRHELRTPHYAIVNDRCHNYGVMLYYITLSSQRQQLADAGFEAQATAYDNKGGLIVNDTPCDSMAIVARKPRRAASAASGS